MIDRAYAAFYVGHDDYERPDNTADVYKTLPTGVPFHGSWSPDWRKPQPGMLRQACTDLGVDPTTALMVGDKEDDGNATVALGMPFIRVNEQSRLLDFSRRKSLVQHKSIMLSW